MENNMRRFLGTISVLLALMALSAPALATEGGNDVRASSFEGFPKSPATYAGFPYSTTGRLYFNGGAECSATSITSPNRSYIVTAAHCLFNRENGSWSTDIAFVPQRLAGVEPVGRWYGRFAGGPGRHDGYIKVPNEYINGSDNYDFGYVVMGTQNGIRLGDRVGAVGYVMGDSIATEDRLHAVLGTPFGADLQGCISSRTGNFTFPSGPPNIIVQCNRLSEGASGGPSLSRISGAVGPKTDQVMAVVQAVNSGYTFNGDGPTIDYLAPLGNRAYEVYLEGASL